MHKFVVCICAVLTVLPFLSAAEENFPFELSFLTSKSSNFATELVYQQQNTQLGFSNKVVIPTSKSEFLRPHGDLLFNHYQQQFNFSLFEQQAGLTSNEPIELHYLHFGSSYALFDNNDFYLSTGFGLTYFSAPDRSFDDELKLSMSFGVYRDFQINKHLSIQLASRVYGTFMADRAFDASNNFICQQECGQTNTLWLQKELSLTIQFTF